MKYRLAAGVRLEARGDGGLLVRNYPCRTIRCNNSLWHLLSTADEDGHMTTSSSVMEALAETGFLQRVWEKLSASDCPMISVIIPVKDREDELVRCLNSVKLLDYPVDRLEIIVVDDGSTDRSAEVAKQAGAMCIPSGGVGAGPAAARNRGAAVACGELLAFLDSDCTVSPGWLRELASPFSEQNIAAVGGLVRGYFTSSCLDRYEDVMSSLTFGSKEKWAGTGKDSFYLPSCNLLVRKENFLELAGFNEDMRVGEDVDFCYRLRDKGFRIGYIPYGEIFHAHRNKITSFMSRRFDYGTSEAILQEKHEDRRKKIQLSITSFFIFLLLPVVLVAPLPGLSFILCLLLLDISRQCRGIKRVSMDASIAGIVLARCRTLFSLGYYVSFHLVRYYLPILIVLLAFVPGFAAFSVLIFFWAASVDYVVKKPEINFLSFVFVYSLEQFAYSCGVFWGCLKRASFISYLVVFQFRPALRTEQKMS